jgi:hypothetical protein
MSHHTTRQVGTIAVRPNVHFGCRRGKKVKGTAIMKAKPQQVASILLRYSEKLLVEFSSGARHSVIQQRASADY